MNALLNLIIVILMHFVKIPREVSTAPVKLVTLEAGTRVLIWTNVPPILIIVYEMQDAQIQMVVLAVLAMPGLDHCVGKHRL